MGRIRIAKAEALPPGRSVKLDFEDRAIALFNADGELHALDDECLHMGASLSSGVVHGGHVVCPWHAWCYDLKTGARVARTGSPLRTYPVTVQDGWIVLGGV